MKPARKPLRALIVEDSIDDAELLLAELAGVGYDVTYERVETASAMKSALARESWDLVLSDYSLPTFSAPAALRVLQAGGYDLPFIIVSGTIGEETAVAALKSGANDFLVKGRLARLAPAIDRELREVAARREREQLEAQLRQSQKMEAIGQLAGGIAHDFNNLLTAILGYGELLREQLRDAPALLEDLDEIHKAGQRAAALTRQLLAFSRRQLLEPQVLDLDQIVEDVKKMLRRIIGEDVRLVTVSTRPGEGRVRADRSQIEQVLLNLAVNARDAMPRGGTLTIRTGFDDPPEGLRPPGAAPPTHGWVSLAVSDTGTGIAADVLPQVFEPFFTTKGPGKGTGLGLSTVYGIVSQSGGHVAVNTELGAGTVFSIYLPAVHEAVESILKPEVVSQSTGGDETILVLEDDAGIRELVRKVLVSRGYRVLEASTGAEALAVSTGHDGVIDLLLSDIVLPDTHGPNIAQLVVARRPEIKVLYMSGFSSRLSIGQADLARNAGILHKPFSTEALLARVRACLDQRASAGRGVRLAPSRAS